MRFRVAILAASVAAWSCVTYAQTITPGGVVNAAGFQAPVAPGSVKSAPNSVNSGLLPVKVINGGVWSRTTTIFVEYAALPEASLTVMTTALLPNDNGALLVGV